MLDEIELLQEVYMSDSHHLHQSRPFLVMGTAFSVRLLTSEENHLPVRQAIVEHATVIADLLRHYVLDMTEDQINCMAHAGTWGTDVEMFALSHLLGICVYYYKEGSWNRISPCTIDTMITESNLCEMGIYLNHPHAHFEVVTSVFTWS